jgi:hypothetical protein
MLLSLTLVSSPRTKHLKTSHNSNRGAAILGRGGGLEHLHLSMLSNETVEVSGWPKMAENFFSSFFFFFFFFLKKKNIFLIFNFF